MGNIGLYSKGKGNKQGEPRDLPGSIFQTVPQEDEPSHDLTELQRSE